MVETTESRTAAGRSLAAILASLKVPGAPRWPGPEIEAICRIEAEAASLRSTSRDSEVREAIEALPRWDANHYTQHGQPMIEDAHGSFLWRSDVLAILDRSSEAAPTPLPEGACGVMQLCELPKGHDGPHTTSVDRALASEAAPVVGLSEERLLDVLQRLEVDGRPVWFVQVDGPGVPPGDIGDERPVARAILARLTQTHRRLLDGDGGMA